MLYNLITLLRPKKTSCYECPLLAWHEADVQISSFKYSDKMRNMNFRALRVEARETFDLTKVHKEQVSKWGLKERVIWKKRYKRKTNCFLGSPTPRKER